MYGFQKSEDQYPPGMPPGGFQGPPMQQGAPWGQPPPYPQQQSYGPPYGGYPPQEGGYPPGGGYSQGGYPQPGGYPQGGYPSGGYPAQGYPPQGGYVEPMHNIPYRPGHHGTIEGQEGFTGFTDPEVRRNFVKKVYLILTVQLVMTGAIVAPFLCVDKVNEWADDNPWMMFVGMGIFLVTQIMLVCCEGLRRQFPTNLILLGLMTFGMGIMCAFITTRYSTQVVVIALGMTAVICLVVSLIAWFAPIDVTGCGMLMCVLMLAFTVFGVIAMICVTVFHLKFMYLVYSGVAVALFSLFLLFDTQQIMGGKRIELSPEEYVLGALQLYIDMIEIFIHLLPLVAAIFNDD